MKLFQCSRQYIAFVLFTTTVVLADIFDDAFDDVVKEFEKKIAEEVADGLDDLQPAGVLAQIPLGYSK